MGGSRYPNLANIRLIASVTALLCLPITGTIAVGVIVGAYRYLPPFLAFIVAMPICVLVAAAPFALVWHGALWFNQNSRTVNVSSDLEVSAAATGRFALYLRPFWCENALRPGRVYTGSRRGQQQFAPISLSETLGRLCEVIDLKVISIGGEGAGSDRILVYNIEWQTMAQELMRKAEAIFVVPIDRIGTREELNWIEEKSYWSKTRFIIPHEAWFDGHPDDEEFLKAVRDGLTAMRFCLGQPLPAPGFHRPVSVGGVRDLQLLLPGQFIAVPMDDIDKATFEATLLDFVPPPIAPHDQVEQDKRQS